MKRFLSVIACAVSLMPSYAVSRSSADGVSFTTGDKTMVCDIRFYSPEIVQVVKRPVSVTADKAPGKSLSVTMTPVNTTFTRTETGSAIRLRTNAMTVTVSKSDGTVAFADAKGRKMLKEGATAFTQRTTGADKGSYVVKQTFRLDKEEPIYGLGIQQNGKMSQRGEDRLLKQDNQNDAVTFFQSVKGYGVFWDNYSPTRFKDNATDGTSFESQVGDCVNYFYLAGGDADGVVAQMRRLTGHVPMQPLWTYGFWQSRERYRSQGELLEVVRRHRELQVPLDGIIQDWQYWGNNYQWNAMEFLSDDFPNPKAMVDEVHKHNAHLMISIWQSFGPMTKQFRELSKKNLLLNFSTWPQSGLGAWPPRMDYPSGVLPIDVFSEETRDIYWRHLTRLHSFGIDAWWMDSTEPDHLDAKDADYELPTALGSFRRVCNAFPLMGVEGVYRHQRDTLPEKRVFILTRSAFAGQQRTGANVWSGDISSSWETLRRQIPAGLNFTMTGNPNFNTDIGGFFVGGYNHSKGGAPRNPLFQELYVRWMQYGIFSTMMRSHGTDIKREVYYFGKKGEPVYDALVDAIKMRYRLLPYIYSTSWQVTNSDYSFTRPLVMDFPKDRKCWDNNNEYMFGGSLLVAPVVNAQYTPEKATNIDELSGWNRDNGGEEQNSNVVVDFTKSHSKEVYLPAGAKWYDFFTGEKHNGNRVVTKTTTLTTIPLYVKAGSIIPIGPDVQYAQEKPWDNLEIRIYPGADGKFTLYEDEFDNYNYEKGAYTTIDFMWNDKRKELTIASRKGSYPGMIKTRTFNVVLPDGSKAGSVSYSGQKTVMKLGGVK